MSWIKRNLALVISGAIALGLLGLGGWYLWSAVEKNNSIDNEINQTKSEIDRLLDMEPSPNKTNLDAAQRETVRLNAFIAEAKRLFPPSPAPAEPLNNQSFKSLLETTVNDLHKQAANVGIKVPFPGDAPYYFTFETQRLPVTFPAESLRPLRDRLDEIQVMMSILIKSRINRLNHIKRTMVPGEVSSGSPASIGDYLNAPPRTNAETGMVLWPYELSFDCFTSELGSVLEEFQRSHYAFVVKAPTFTPAEEIRTGSRPLPPPLTNRPVVTPTLQTVINERLLRVTLRLDLIKPEPMQGGPGPGSGGGPPRGPGPRRAGGSPP